MTDTYEDLPPPLRRAAATYGRDLVGLVYNAGVATEAMKVLVAGGRRSEGMIRAARTISEIFNHTSSELCRQRGWTQEMLAAAEGMIEADFASATGPQLLGPDGQAIKGH